MKRKNEVILYSHDDDVYVAECGMIAAKKRRELCDEDEGRPEEGGVKLNEKTLDCIARKPW